MCVCVCVCVCMCVCVCVRVCVCVYRYIDNVNNLKPIFHQMTFGRVGADFALGTFHIILSPP